MNPLRPKLAIYGGAFNPPTVGHARTAERLIAAGFSRVLVMPCYGHSFGKTLAPAADRLLMATECFREFPEARVSSFEIDLGMNGSTFELVEKLSMLSECRTHEVFFAIGSDEANAITRWRRHEELREKIPFVVVPREGALMDDRGTWATKAPHFVIPRDQNYPPAIASTLVREALENGDRQSAARLLAPRVLEHIASRELYAPRKSPAAAAC